ARLVAREQGLGPREQALATARRQPLGSLEQRADEPEPHRVTAALERAQPRGQLGPAQRDAPSRRGTGAISTRRLRARFSSLSFGATGWVSPKPAPKTRSGGRPAAMSARTTVIARSDDSCQLSRSAPPRRGRSSVKPLTMISASCVSR